MENILVAIRFKPHTQSSREDSHSSRLTDCWKIYLDPHNTVCNLRTKQSYTFDYVFSEEATNLQVFDILALPLIQSSIEGINATIFAYGQTSSGKTHTIHGSSQSPGLVYQGLSYMFAHIKSSLRTFSLRLSYLEVYNEQINDLLDTSKTNLEIREHPERGIYVEKLSEIPINSEKEALDLLRLGESNKKTGETQMNQTSSRSHTVLKLVIESADEFYTRSSQLNFVDLAGSEGVQKSKVEDIRLREGSNINKSLLSLSSVIQKLSEGKKSFVNFRDSKMTRLLQPALWGNFRTAVICTVNPESAHYQETNNTLLFGSKAKRIKNDVRLNEILMSEEILKGISDDNKKLIERNQMLESLAMKYAETIHGLQVDGYRKDGIISMLKEELKIKDDELNSLTTKAEELQKELQFVKRVVQEETCKRLALEENRKNLESDVRMKIEQLTDEHRNSINALTEQMSFLQKILEEKEFVIKNLGDDDLHIKIELEKTQNKLKAAIANMEEAEILKNNQIIKIEESMKENQRLLLNIEDCFRIIKQKEVDECNTKAILVKSQEEISHYKNEIQQLTTVLGQLHISMNMAENTLMQISLESSIKSETLSIIESDLLIKTQHALELENRIQALTLSLDSLASNLFTSNRALLESSKLADSQATELSVLTSKLSASQKECSTLLSQVSITSNELLINKSKLTELEKIITTKNIEIQGLQSKITSNAEDLAFFMKKNETENSSLVEMNKHKSLIIIELHSEVKSYNDKLKSLQTTFENTKTRCKQIEIQNEKYASDQADQELRVDIQNAFIENQDEELRSLRAYKEEISKEVTKLKNELCKVASELDEQVNEKLLIESKYYRIKDNIIFKKPQNLHSSEDEELYLVLVEENRLLKAKGEEIYRELSLEKEKNKELERLRNLVKDLEGKLKDSTSQLDSSKKESRMYQRQSELKRLSSNLIDENMLESIKASEKYKLNFELTKLSSEIKILNEDLGLLEKDCKEAKAKVKSRDDTIDKLVYEKAELKKKNDELENIVLKSQEELEYLSAERDALLMSCDENYPRRTTASRLLSIDKALRRNRTTDEDCNVQ